jgi:RelB Antitoxin alpha helical domain
MRTIKKKYIVNERNEKIAVQLDIKTFEKIERVMEDYVLGEKMIENDKADRLSVNEAKEFYKRLKKRS